MNAPDPVAAVAEAVLEPLEIVDLSFPFEERRRRRRAWVLSVLVLLALTAGTVVLLLVQWMATGSGTVAR